MMPRPEENVSAQESEDDPAVFDLGGALDRFDGDRTVLRMIVLCFLEDAPRQLLLLRSTCSNGNWPETERIAHSLRGASASIGAAGAACAAFRLESAARSDSASDVPRYLDALDDALTLFRRAVSGTEFADRTTAPVAEDRA